MANRLKFTPSKKKKFCETIIATGGNVTAAARACAVSPQSAYEHRREDELFAAAWDAAVEEGIANLEEEAYRRAFHGTDKPVYQGGKLAGLVREYSDTLTIFLLKARRPKIYRERIEHSGPDGAPLAAPQVNLQVLTLEQLDQLEKLVTLATSEAAGESAPPSES